MSLVLGPSQARALALLETWRQRPASPRHGNHLFLGARGVGKSTVLKCFGARGAKRIEGSQALGWLTVQNRSVSAYSPRELAERLVEYAKTQVDEREWGVYDDIWPYIQPYLSLAGADSSRLEFLKALERTQTEYRLLIWEIPSNGPVLLDGGVLKSMFDHRVRVDKGERAVVLGFQEQDGINLFTRGLAAHHGIRSYYEARISQLPIS